MKKTFFTLVSLSLASPAFAANIPFTKTARLLKKYPYYANSFIPVSNYPTVLNKEDNPTFGVKATLVTSSDVSEKVVYAITKEVFENFERFKKLHPAYATLTKKPMLEGLTAPVIITVGAQNGLVVPLIAAHLFVFYFGILADDTPPVGLAAFAAAIAKSDPIKTRLQGFMYDI